MKALIALVENLMKVDEEEEENDSIEQKNINGELTLRNLISDEDKEYLKIYGNHVLPIWIFIAIGISCIFGYFVCWFCYCCNCCCCCCFKKPLCKLPIFIFNYLLYALIISFSIYGMVKSKKIFKGFANIECSLLQFFDQILKGENKETTPKWIGINKIEMFFKDLESTLLNMKEENLLEDMDYLLYNIHFKKNEFMSQLRDLHKGFYEVDEITPLEKYCVNYPTFPPFNYYKKRTLKQYLKGKYVLDLIPKLGKYNNQKKEFEPGLISDWNLEISALDNMTVSSLSEIRISLESILTNNLGGIVNSLEKGKKQLKMLKKPFDNIYDEIKDIIYDTSNILEEGGKITIYFIFGILIFFHILLAINMLLIIFK